MCYFKIAKGNRGNTRKELQHGEAEKETALFSRNNAGRAKACQLFSGRSRERHRRNPYRDNT